MSVEDVVGLWAESSLKGPVCQIFYVRLAELPSQKYLL
jgi:hypothetical protein